MDTKAFETKLKSDGYTEIEIKSYNPHPPNGEHRHHFSVSGLVLDGEFIVVRDQKPVAYRTGDIFAVPQGCLHGEEIGSKGARVLVGRKYEQTA